MERCKRCQAEWSGVHALDDCKVIASLRARLTAAEQRAGEALSTAAVLRSQLDEADATLDLVRQQRTALERQVHRLTHDEEIESDRLCAHALDVQAELDAARASATLWRDRARSACIGGPMTTEELAAALDSKLTASGPAVALVNVDLLRLAASRLRQLELVRNVAKQFDDGEVGT